MLITGMKRAHPSPPPPALSRSSKVSKHREGENIKITCSISSEEFNLTSTPLKLEGNSFTDWGKIISFGKDHSNPVSKSALYNYCLSQYRDATTATFPHSRQTITQNELSYLNIPTFDQYNNNKPYYDLEYNLYFICNSSQSNEEQTTNINSLLDVLKCSYSTTLPIKSIVTLLIKYEFPDINQINIKSGSSIKSLLYVAAENNSADSIRALKDAGLNLTTDFGSIQYGPDGKTKTWTISSLFIAAQKNFADSIRALTVAGVNPNKDSGGIEYGPDGITQTHSSLFIAAEYNSADSIRALKDAYLNLTTDSGSTQYGSYGITQTRSSLFIAAEKNSANSILALKDAGLNLTTDSGSTRYGPDGKKTQSRSSLFIAAGKNSADSIRVLIDAGVNPNVDSGGIQYGPDGIKTQSNSSLSIAAAKNSANSIRALTDAGVKPNKDSGVINFAPDGQTKIQTISSLFIAAAFNSADSIRALKYAGVKPNKDSGAIKYSPDGEIITEQTALQVATAKEHHTIIRLLSSSVN